MASWWDMVRGQTYEISDRGEDGLLWEAWIVESLPDKQWKALWLRAHGYTTQEAARELGCSQATVRSNRRHALKRLRTLASEIARFDSNI